MAKPPVIDLPALLEPFEGAVSPSGEDPRGDTSPASLYFKVKDARLAARAIERSNIDADALVPEPWETVRSAAQTLLATRAKDIEVAAWLTEALVRIDGFAGLRDGLLLIKGLADGFWETLYPLIDEEDDGVEGRVSSVSGLNGTGAPGTIAQTLRTLPLIGISKPMSVWNYDQANEIDKITDKERKAARIASGGTSMEVFRESLVETSGAELYETLMTVEEAAAALAAMAASFDAVAGYDAPPTAAVRDLLAQISSSIRFFGADKIAPQIKAAEAKANAGSADASAPTAATAAVQSSGADADTMMLAGPAARTGGFASRHEALEAVLKLADYFEKTEPQAPISYTLVEAVRRARLSLPELLAELSNDPKHIAYFTLAAGFRIDASAPAINMPTAPSPASTPEITAQPESSSQSRGGW